MYNINVNMKRISSLLLIVFLFFFTQNKIFAVNSYQEGPYFNNTDRVDITNDINFQNHTYSFNKGENVYVRITTERFKNQILINDLRLRNYQGVIIATTSISQKTFTSPYIFEGVITIPSSIADYGYLDLDFQWGRQAGGTILEGKFAVSQALEMGGIGQNFRYYNSNLSEEKYMFRSNAIIYIKAWGTGQEIKSGQLSIKKLDGSKSIFIIPKTSITKDGNWYSFSFDLSKYVSTDGWSYAGEVSIRDVNNTYILYSNKFFTIDNTLPISNITFPAANSTILRQVSVKGSASDNNFRQYQLFVEDTANPGIWNSLSSIYSTQIKDDVLYIWDTNNYVGKKINLKLVVLDWAENQGISIIPNVIVDGYLSFSTPNAKSFNDITTSTSDQISTGFIGAGTGKDDIIVSDSRFNKPGWVLTVRFSDFNFEDQVIPVSNLTIIPQDFQVISGSATGINKGTTHRFTGVNDVATMLSASTGNGNGSYWQNAKLELIVPANGVIGQYSSTATFTMQ